MKNKSLFSVLIAAWFSLAVAGFAFAVDKGPATIILKAGRKGDVTFLHHQHQEHIKCSVCHHSKGPDGKQVPYKEGQKIEKCATCHNKGMANRRLNSTMKAFHKNCKTCHRKNKKGPTRCNGCHKKK